MREEAAERKALENERKKIEQEEAKFNTEIDKIKEQLKTLPKMKWMHLTKEYLNYKASYPM